MRCVSCAENKTDSGTSLDSKWQITSYLLFRVSDRIFRGTRSRTLVVLRDAADHIKVFATRDAAEKWLRKTTPEGVAFEYVVLE